MTIPLDLVVEGETRVIVVDQDGVPEARLVPSPEGKPNGYQLAVVDNTLQYVPPPDGSGDMRTAVYDPRMRANDAFALDFMDGDLDCGTF